jgi:predicted ester cyclase
MGSVEEENKQMVRQFFEAFDRPDTERIRQLVSSTDYTFHFLGMPPMDWNGHKQFIIAITNAFPDVHHEIVEMIAEGEHKVTDRFNITGTHEGEFPSV